MTEGQDWAGYQTARPSTAGLGFVFVKATEGTTYTNPRHDTQVAAGRAGGLVVGHYHFQRPGSGVAQAAYFLKHAKPQAGDVLACDWEDTGVSCADKDAFIRAVKAAQPHLRAVLYCNRDFWLHRDTSSYCADGLWIADPSAPKGQPRIEADWLFHQYGSPGGLDRNYSPLTPAQLAAWAAGTTITPQQEDDVPISNEDALKVAGYVAAFKNPKLEPQGPDLRQRLVNAEAYGKASAAGIRALTAQVAALTATVSALATKGGLTAAEITAAAQAGAEAALDQLGDALTKEN